MAGERTIPILPCRELDDVLAFYGALGFGVSYRQLRPNPYAVVCREDLHLHFAAIDGFDPATSYASAIVLVPDAGELYRAFADGLRGAYGKLPVAGIPRLLRPRAKRGTTTGFSVVDPGGNWIRVYRDGDQEEASAATRGLALAVDSAARLGDARGDDATAAKMLDAALRRHLTAPPEERVPALVYRAELAVRLGDPHVARAALAEVQALELDGTIRERLGDDLAAAEELADQLT